jgi:receptor expression-enhancing protein 5/6
LLQEKFKSLEKQTGYPKVYFFLLAFTTVCSVIYGLGGSKLVSDLVSFVYPAYMSFKAIDSSNAVEHTQWLTYWVVYSFMTILENVCGFITEFIPFYFFIKVAFFIWLYHPKFKGAGLVYTEVIKPFVMPYLSSLHKKSAVTAASAPTKKTE